MSILMLGLNHKVAPIDVREQFYLNNIQQELLLSELKCNPSVVEAFVISTCNRIEIYVNLIDDTLNIPSFIKHLCSIKNIEYTSQFDEYFYNYSQSKAIKHLLEVITGLDSLVLGEKQILGQVKASFEQARNKAMLGKDFNILANLAIRTGKKVRTETQIDIGGSSVSWAAIRQAEKELTTLEDKSVLMIGAGEMSTLAVGQVHSKGFHKLFLMNRTPENARKLADRFDGEYVAFCDIKEVLAKTDLCICSSSAPHYIIDHTVVEKALALRDDKPLLFIDISMPRNLDPKIATLDNVTLYHIDDLKIVV
ncbi:MAG: glutamyl-tRNA reductase, partial [Candidatus Omnitrophota bacterium]